MELLSVFFGGGGVKVVTVGWDVWKTVKRFPLKGGGMTQLNKIHCVLKNGHPHTTHHLSPSQFPKAEGCNSLVSSFFQPLFNSLFLCPLSLSSLILSSLVR